MEAFILLYYFLIIVPSSILHEYAHGWVADQLGDPTARYAGRLTLDPRAHIDAWGTILMPIILLGLTNGRFLFAYAKPVPYNPYNLKNQKWGPALVSLAGPAANLVLAVAFAGVFRLLPLTHPIAPFIEIIVYANVLLMVFNLVPIPPLDGSKVLFAIIPDSLANVRVFLERYGFWILIVFIFFIFKFLYPLFNFLMKLLLGQG